MRSLTMAALGAALLLGCGDDSDDGGETADASTSDAGHLHDAGSLDAGADSGLDAKTPDASSAGDAGFTRARATLESKSGSMVTGSAAFATVNGVVTLELAISGASPGEHGAHIHETPDCSAVNAVSAGGHWNPDMHMHGSPTGMTHLGDLGNIMVGADGKGVLSISKAEWTLGTGAATDVIRHAIVVHANQDDLMTQTGDAGPGNSGGRQACGVIMGI